MHRITARIFELGDYEHLGTSTLRTRNMKSRYQPPLAAPSTEISLPQKYSPSCSESLLFCDVRVNIIQQ